jgi:transposase
MVNHLERLAFVEETSARTSMAETTGWAPRGPRRIDHAPSGHRRARTFIAALRHDRLDAPWVIGGATNGGMFGLFVETRLAPTLRQGDVVILDNLARHKRPKAAQTPRQTGARFLFLPPCSPDLDPIDMAFSKLKALTRKQAARTCDQLWAAVGQVCDLSNEEECLNDFKAAGYKAE